MHSSYLPIANLKSSLNRHFRLFSEGCCRDRFTQAKQGELIVEIYTRSCCATNRINPKSNGWKMFGPKRQTLVFAHLSAELAITSSSVHFMDVFAQKPGEEEANTAHSVPVCSWLNTYLYAILLVNTACTTYGTVWCKDVSHIFSKYWKCPYNIRRFHSPQF